MDPSEEKKERSKHGSKKKSSVLPAALIVLLLLVIGVIVFFFTSSLKPPLPLPGQDKEKSAATSSVNESSKSRAELPETIIVEESVTDEQLPSPPSPGPATLEEQQNGNTEEDNKTTPQLSPPPLPGAAQEPVKVSLCSQPEQRLDDFYTHLDKQPYMKSYNVSSSNQEHFTKLIEKLLANPPTVTRESDDLYTILKNTAHFFRISGKDNILMLQGILNSEKEFLEGILADYYSLLNTSECADTKYAKGIQRDALYEYACFFLNTMGGRLYLFRRDSQSRMIVTYYAILLVDLANTQQYNRHGLDLKSSVNMLISEMESGGSNLKGSEEYLDTLYALKEKYQ